MASPATITEAPDTQALLAELRALHQERVKIIANWRQPIKEFPALFEAVIMRGMSTPSIGEQLGVSGEAVARRLRPIKAHYGVTGAPGWVQREVLASIPRPYQSLSFDQLVEAVKQEHAGIARSHLRQRRRSRELLDRMSVLIRRLERDPTMNDRVIARDLGVSEITVSRFRRKV